MKVKLWSDVRSISLHRMLHPYSCFLTKTYPSIFFFPKLVEDHRCCLLQSRSELVRDLRTLSEEVFAMENAETKIGLFPILYINTIQVELLSTLVDLLRNCCTRSLLRRERLSEWTKHVNKASMCAIFQYHGWLKSMTLKPSNCDIRTIEAARHNSVVDWSLNNLIPKIAVLRSQLMNITEVIFSPKMCALLNLRPCEV